MTLDGNKISPKAWGFMVLAAALLLWALILAVSDTGWLDMQRLNPLSLRVLPLPFQANELWRDAMPPVVLAGLVVASTLWLPRRPWSMGLLAMVLIAVALRYFAWRATTLNTAHPLGFTLSTVQFFTELLYLLTASLELLPSLRFDPDFRSRQADQLQAWISRNQPNVDVWIPTYNEPSRLVRRAIIACRNLSYTRRTITVLDDGHRPEIAELAARLGVNYLSREDNAHRKAGNLNYALARTSAEFIAVFDCDFIVFPNFLERTLGFFADPNVALVQTPQHYFQAEFHTHNLGLDAVMPSDLDLFFRYQQVIRDRSNAVVCCGTSYVARRQALEDIGGYVTSCLIEDHQTSTKLLTRGWTVRYLNEVLSMGEVPRTFADFLDQRLRWMQGNIQIYFSSRELPIWKKLNRWQQSFYLTLAVSSLTPLWRLCYLVLPLLSLLIGFTLIAAPPLEYLSYGVPFVLLLHALPSWLCNYHQFQFWNEVYETLFCVPGIRRLLQVLRRPFQIYGGIVTRKDATTSHQSMNINLSWPLLAMLAVLVVTLMLRYVLPLLAPRLFGWHQAYDGESLMLVWNLYNGVVLTLALLACIDQPSRRATDRFPIRCIGYIELDGQQHWGTTADLSEEGACFVTQSAEQATIIPGRAQLRLVAPSLSIGADVVRASSGRLALQFHRGDETAQAGLLNLLYSSEHWFHRPRRLTRSDALLHWFRALWRPDPIVRRFS